MAAADTGRDDVTLLGICVNLFFLNDCRPRANQVCNIYVFSHTFVPLHKTFAPSL